MSNIDFELELRDGELNVVYNSLHGSKYFCEKGFLTEDQKTFFVRTKSIINNPYLSITEKKGIISFVSRESNRRGYPSIVFLD